MPKIAVEVLKRPRWCPLCNEIHDTGTVRRHLEGQIRPRTTASALARGFYQFPEAQARSGQQYGQHDIPPWVEMVPTAAVDDWRFNSPAMANGADSAMLGNLTADAGVEHWAPAAEVLGGAIEENWRHSRSAWIESVDEYNDEEEADNIAGVGEDMYIQMDGEGEPYDPAEDDEDEVKAYMAELEVEWERHIESFGECCDDEAVHLDLIST
jgi:hypothetical protein